MRNFFIFLLVVVCLLGAVWWTGNFILSRPTSVFNVLLDARKLKEERTLEEERQRLEREKEMGKDAAVQASYKVRRILDNYRFYILLTSAFLFGGAWMWVRIKIEREKHRVNFTRDKTSTTIPGEEAVRFLEKDFQLEEQRIKLSAIQEFRKLHKELQPQELEQEEPLALEAAVPTFRELLRDGEIAPARSMILGFEQGLPRRGSLRDIYSCADVGESGSGKTSTMLFLVGSAIVTSRAQFFPIDPHFPDDGSLGAQTQPLWEAGLMSRPASTRTEIEARVKAFGKLFWDRRRGDKDRTPLVLLVEEVLFLKDEPFYRHLMKLMENIAIGGRKFGLFLLVSTQDVRKKKGFDFRDALTSAYVHRLRPKQASLFLQDKDELDKWKAGVRKEGQVLFCPRLQESVICQMPFATKDDMEMVVDLVQDRSQYFEIEAEALMKNSDPEPTPESDEKNLSYTVTSGGDAVPLPSPGLVLELMQANMKASGMTKTDWQKAFARQSGISASLLKLIMLEKRNVTPETAKKVLPYLTKEMV